MNRLKKYDYLRLLLGISSTITGVLFCVFSTYSFMELFLGYLLASILLIFSLIMIIITFIKENEHFFRIFFYVFLIGISVCFFIDPSTIIKMVPILLGVFLICSGIIYLIKFIILKRVNLNSLFNILQVVIALLIIGIGVVFAIFYARIDTIITSILIGIPLTIFGILISIFAIIRLIRNR